MTDFTGILVRVAKESDASDIAKLFYETVRIVNRKDYSQEQVEAWAPCIRPASYWIERQSTRRTYVGVLNDKVIGFAELEPSGHIDCFYCHKDHQRCGAGRALLQAIKKEAEKQRNQKIFAEVSISAVPFFEQQGFRLVREQQVTVREVTMTNFVMELELGC